MRITMLLVLLSFAGTFALGQVKDVSYALEYNPETCLFDCYLVINDGSAKSIKDRAQFNAQISVVVPYGTNAQIEETYMPLERNQAYDGSLPTLWEISNYLEGPTAANDKSFFSITPNLSPTSFYNDLEEGDRVRLFGIRITPVKECGEGISLFDNENHPYSGAAGMKGGDFSNGFTIGGINQKYNDNKETVLPPAPQINKVNISGDQKVEVKLEMATSTAICGNNLSYAWYGPQGLISEAPYLAAQQKSKYDRGVYRVVVTNGLGCSDEESFSFYPEVPEDVEVITGIDVTDSDYVKFESSIFPNPTTDLVNLKVTTSPGTHLKVSIQDITGKVILNNLVDVKLTSNTYETRIPLTLETGVYSLVLKINNSEVKSHKLLIVK